MKSVMKNMVALIIAGVMYSGCAFMLGAAGGGVVAVGAHEYAQGELSRPYAATMGTDGWLVLRSLEIFKLRSPGLPKTNPPPGGLKVRPPREKN